MAVTTTRSTAARYGCRPLTSAAPTPTCSAGTTKTSSVVEAVDAAVRTQAFAVLVDLKQIHGDSPIPRAALEKGFEFDGVRVPFLGPQGIFKPAILPDVPLSITTVPPVPGKPRPYDDNIGEGGVISYRYRGEDPRHRDNVGLRLAMERQTPLIYFHGIVPGLYEPAWPVYVVGDDPARLTFSVMADERSEEHTSELQSHSFISYALFCLKKT